MVKPTSLFKIKQGLGGTRLMLIIYGNTNVCKKFCREAKGKQGYKKRCTAIAVMT